MSVMPFAKTPSTLANMRVSTTWLLPPSQLCAQFALCSAAPQQKGMVGMQNMNTLFSSPPNLENLPKFEAFLLCLTTAIPSLMRKA